MLMLLGFVFMIVAMIPHLNPPAQENRAEPPGNLIVSISWPDGDTDVDLWVYGPGEPKPVGYSNKSGVLWNLLRDDLGKGNDLSGVNYENAFTRGVVAGEYIVNVHCYRCLILPIPVIVEISIKQKNAYDTNAQIKRLVNTRVVLMSNKEELTAIRFRLDNKGNIVPNSMNHVFRRLREAYPVD